MTGLLLAGTSSDAGKSLVATGLCRVLRRRGLAVAPYKAQNMSNNSMICANGAEIGRAQYLQAQAARVAATADMNPVLLKPGDDRTSHVVLNGYPHGILRAGEYATGRTELAAAAFAAYERLAEAYDVVVCEGAGSPAEINLRHRDYVNMGLARRFELPVVLVGDIDRGGLLASLYGTWGLVDDADRALLRGYIVNKFRGDPEVLAPGLVTISERTGMASYGVLPWLPDVWLDAEDALSLSPSRGASTSATLQLAAVRLPRISNATDLDALASEPGVNLVLTDDPRVVLAADLAILPGSRATLGDLAWLRERGLDQAFVERGRRGLPSLGICGGYEMFARRILDGVESGVDSEAGLGLLPAEVVFEPAKVQRVASYPWGGGSVTGYEIHHGVVELAGAAEPFLDGCRVGNTYGTMLHGAFEDDAFRTGFLAAVAQQAGSAWQPQPGVGYGQRREAMIEALADAIQDHIDVDAMMKELR